MDPHNSHTDRRAVQYNGELDHHHSDRVERIIQAWADCGAEAVQPENIHIAIWTKFMFIASFGGVSSLGRANAGEFLGCQPTRDLFICAMQEVDALAQSQGINLAPDAVEKSLAMADAFEPTATSSMQRDVETGNLFELEAFSGTIVRLGQKYGVPTPVHSALYALLMPGLVRAMQSHNK